MKLKFFKYLCFLLMLVLISCTKTIDFEGDTPEQLLVMNSVLILDSVVKVHLSKSKFFLSNSSDFQNVGNAQVFLTLNDNPKVMLKYLQDGVYESSAKLKANDFVLITATAPNLKSVSSSEVVQPQITILSIDTTQAKLTDTDFGYNQGNLYNQYGDTIIGHFYSRELRVKIKFQDNANVQNFYRLNAYKLSTYAANKYSLGGQNIDNYSIKYDDVVFGNNSQDGATVDFGSGGSNNNLFSDELINGKEYVLSIKTTVQINEYLPGKEPVGENKQSALDLVVDFQQLSKGCYLYYKTVNASNPGDFFAEPVQIYNNIKDGLGILGSYSHSVKTFKLQ